jgi:hypothetical protein
MSDEPNFVDIQYLGVLFLKHAIQYGPIQYLAPEIVQVTITSLHGIVGITDAVMAVKLPESGIIRTGKHGLRELENRIIPVGIAYSHFGSTSGGTIVLFVIKFTPSKVSNEIPFQYFQGLDTMRSVGNVDIAVAPLQLNHI